VLARPFAPALGITLLSVALLAAPAAASAQESSASDTGGYLWTAPPEPAPAVQAPENFPWAVTLYGGPFTKQDFLEFFSEPVEFDHAGMVTVALSREVGVLWKHIRWETEIGVTKWFGDQTHWEFTSAIVARWITFPWNDYVKTTIAVGDGPSFATKPPRLEKKNFDEAKRLQNYVFLELTFGLPRYPQWDFVIRIHHRSGVFGVLGGSGSSIPAIGVKYKF
jgi:hypothetical protein